MGGERPHDRGSLRGTSAALLVLLSTAARARLVAADLLTADDLLHLSPSSRHSHLNVSQIAILLAADIARKLFERISPAGRYSHGNRLFFLGL